jgi:hypothetical protein
MIDKNGRVINIDDKCFIDDKLGIVTALFEDKKKVAVIVLSESNMTCAEELVDPKTVVVNPL